MSNTSDSTIFSKMTSRGAGKRQIKPTPLLFASLENDHDTDDDDDDFEMKTDQDETTADSASGSESGSGSGSDSDEEDEDIEEDEKNEQNIGGTERSSETRESDVCSLVDPICGVCINRRKVEDNFEFMQCDSCGIHVHESCYAGVVLDETEEENKTTTNWFCEPCMYGLKEPPYCEFCPSRYGAFKRTDVGGRWVHLSCALFTPEVTFSAVEILSGVSWQEAGNAIFGKRACGLCENRIESRVGVASRCESGLCKTFLHITCAQKLGLLVDETDDHDENEVNDTNIVSLMRYFFCKKHSHSEELKRLRKTYLVWEKQEINRITVNRRRKPLNEEEEKNRRTMMEKLEHTFVNLKDITINIPTEAIEKNRRARLLHSSAEFVDRFESKTLDNGGTIETFQGNFLNIQLTNSSFIPIGFSKEYIDYIKLRDDTLIPEEENKLMVLREVVKEAKEKQYTQAHSNELIEEMAENQSEIDRKKELISNFCTALLNIGDKKNDFSIILKTLNDEKETYANGAKKEQTNGITTKSKFKKAEKRRAVDEDPAELQVTKKCGECQQTNDQHKMAECDECHVCYHIGCTNPPLLRLPKRSAKFGWICHECNESSSSEKELELDISDATTDANGSRSTRSRRPPVRHSSFFEH